jgi:hypothetical protein
MNKAFVRESDDTSTYCPRCGSQGEQVGAAVLQRYLVDEQLGRLAGTVQFCPSPKCPVAYFDSFERFILAADLTRPAYPKDPDAPMCACFGVTRADVDQDVDEGAVTRTRAAVEKAKSPLAHCSELAANGRPCIAYLQKYFMQRRQESTRPPNRE